MAMKNTNQPYSFGIFEKIQNINQTIIGEHTAYICNNLQAVGKSLSLAIY